VSKIQWYNASWTGATTPLCQGLFCPLRQDTLVPN
jgi:hypothetical protein